MSVDPLVNQTSAPYFYAEDNPVNGTDPTGLCPTEEDCQETYVKSLADIAFVWQNCVNSGRPRAVCDSFKMALMQDAYDTLQRCLENAPSPEPSPNPAVEPNNGFHITKKEIIGGVIVVGAGALIVASGGLAGLLGLAAL